MRTYACDGNLRIMTVARIPFNELKETNREVQSIELLLSYFNSKLDDQSDAAPQPWRSAPSPFEHAHPPFTHYGFDHPKSNPG